MVMKNFLKNEIKNTKQLFKILNISQQTLSAEQRNSLNDKGFVIIPPTTYILKNLKKLNKISEELIKIEGSKGGWEGKEKHYVVGKFFENGANRLGNLIDKHEVFRDLILIPEILAASYEVIKSDIKVGGVDLRNPLKDLGHQAIHIDWMPRERKSDPFIGVVCFIYLDDSNINNGAVRIVPRSHKKLGWPDEHVDIFKFHKDEIRMIAPAGTIVVMNLNLWHAGTKNISGEPRKTLFIDIRSRDQSQLLNFKKYLKTKTKKELNVLQSYLLGVRECDKTQKEDSIGPGEIYRKRFGNKRGDFQKKIIESIEYI